MTALCACGCLTPIPSSNRYVRGHNARLTGPEYIEEDRSHTTPCWVWQKSISPKGYAYTRSGGKKHIAHVLFYERRHGPVPDGLQLDHLCRVRECVNPAHLEPVTVAVNVQRSMTATLNPDLVRAIRKLFHLTNREIADRFGVSPGAISQIRTGRTWSNVA